MKCSKYAVILWIFIALWQSESDAQVPQISGVRLARITYLTANLDSLTRSYLKRGYRVTPGMREPAGEFNDRVLLPNGSEVILETTLSTDPTNWRRKAIATYGTHVCGMAFETDAADSLHALLRSDSVAVSDLCQITMQRADGSLYRCKGFALDSAGPVEMVFFTKDTSASRLPEFDSLSHHPNHVYRFDWVLLAAGSAAKERIRTVLSVISTWSLHEGCCDYWRVGPADDFCFFRFEPPPKKYVDRKNWLSVESDNIYYAY